MGENAATVLGWILVGIIVTIIAFSIDVSTGIRVALCVFALAYDAAVILRFFLRG